MPVISSTTRVSKKTNKKVTYFYIIENKYTLDPESGRKKNKKIILESLGACGVRAAKIALARHQLDEHEILSNDTLEGLLTKFQAEYKKTVKSQGTYDLFCHLVKHLKPVFELPVRKIEFDEITQLQILLFEKNLSVNYVKKIINALFKILKFAVRKRKLDRLPYFEFIKEESPRTIAVFSPDDVVKLLSMSHPQLKFYQEALYLTGMRPQELRLLKKTDINFNSETITIRSDNPKKPGRILAMTPRLKRLFKDCPDGFISPYRRKDSARNAVKRLGEKLGITAYPYKWRHTFASEMAAADVAIAKLSEIMGSSSRTLEKYYINLKHVDLKPEMEKHPHANA